MKKKSVCIFIHSQWLLFRKYVYNGILSETIEAIVDHGYLRYGKTALKMMMYMIIFPEEARRHFMKIFLFCHPGNCCRGEGCRANTGSVATASSEDSDREIGESVPPD